MEIYDWRLLHTSSGSAMKDKISFLPFVSGCAKTKLKAKTAQSLRKQSFLPSLVLTVFAFANMELQHIC